MKAIFKIILAIYLVTGIENLAHSQDNSQQWNQANNFYTSQEYKKAIDTYEQILLTGQESAKLYFNLGNAYYKAGNTNKAILNYERAKLLAPGDEDIEFNLKVANQFVVTRTEELPKPFFTRKWNSFVNTFTADKWAMVSIVTFVAFLGLLGVYLFGRSLNLKRIAFWSGIVMLIFSISGFSLASTQKKQITKRNHAIVFSPRVTVKSTPSASGTDLFLIYEGLKVEVTQTIDKWDEIKLADGNKGWLPDSCIVKI